MLTDYEEVNQTESEKTPLKTKKANKITNRNKVTFIEPHGRRKVDRYDQASKDDGTDLEFLKYRPSGKFEKMKND